MSGIMYEMDLIYFSEAVGELNAVNFPTEWTVELSNGKIVSL